MTNKAFFEKLKPYVIADMKSSGILASLTAAQAFVESNHGNSGLGKAPNNNLFGIKGNYKGQSVKMWTTEYYNGVKTRIQADFRKYPSWAESIADHSSLFNRLSRYKNLRGLTDYKLACKYVQADGYATSPTYATNLIDKIEKFKLYEWDKEVSILPTLKYGDANPYVTAWQKYLQTQGYPLSADGIFGNITLQCVRDWQDRNGLEVTGNITETEWHKIGVF